MNPFVTNQQFCYPNQTKYGWVHGLCDHNWFNCCTPTKSHMSQATFLKQDERQQLQHCVTVWVG